MPAKNLLTYDDCVNAVLSSLDFKYIPERFIDDDLCILAITNSRWSTIESIPLKYLTEPVLLGLSKVYPRSFRDIPIHLQTEAICMMAIEYNPILLSNVRDQTETICRLAVRKNTQSLKYVRMQSYSIIKIAAAKYQYQYIDYSILSKTEVKHLQLNTPKRKPTFSDYTRTSNMSTLSAYNYICEHARDTIDPYLINLAARYRIDIFHILRTQPEESIFFAISSGWDILPYIRYQSFEILHQIILNGSAATNIYIDWSCVTENEAEYLRLL